MLQQTISTITSDKLSKYLGGKANLVVLFKFIFEKEN